MGDNIGNIVSQIERKYIVWLGDFNAMKFNTNIVPNMKQKDPRCVLFGKIDARFKKNGYINATDHLWSSDLYTHQIRNSEIKKSILDYVIVSENMARFNHRIEPVYNTDIIFLIMRYIYALLFEVHIYPMHI